MPRLTLDGLTRETVNAQFCSDWLKDEIIKLFHAIEILKEDRQIDSRIAQSKIDALRAELKTCVTSHQKQNILCEKLEGENEKLKGHLQVAVEALRKVDDPMQFHHWEEDAYTRAACFQFVAHEAIAKIRDNRP